MRLLKVKFITSTKDTSDSNLENVESRNTQDKAQVGLIEFKNIELPNSRMVTNDFYDVNNKRDVIIRQSFMIHNDYKQFDLGEGVLDISFLYSPENDNVSEIEHPEDELSISIGICKDSYQIIKNYEETSQLPEYATLYKVSNSKAVYKTVISYKKLNSTYVEYHFRRGFDDELYSQMQLIIPNRLLNSELAKEGERVLEQIVSTYSEKIIEGLDQL